MTTYETIQRVPADVNLSRDDNSRFQRVIGSEFSSHSELQQAYREVFGGEAGGKVLRHILAFTAVERTPYSPQGVEQTHVNIGKGLVGLFLKDIIFGDIVKKGAQRP